MQRGKQLFDKLTGSSENTALLNKPSRRGRNEILIENRNECLLYRYYYYAKIKRLRYEDVLEVVSKEFFISTRTITNILMEESEYQKKVFKEKLDVKELEKKFDFLKWKTT
jgi:hypothetical protein